MDPLSRFGRAVWIDNAIKTGSMNALRGQLSEKPVDRPNER